MTNSRFDREKFSAPEFALGGIAIVAILVIAYVGLRASQPQDQPTSDSLISAAVSNQSTPVRPATPAPVLAQTDERQPARRQGVGRTPATAPNPAAPPKQSYPVEASGPGGQTSQPARRDVASGSASNISNSPAPSAPVTGVSPPAQSPGAGRLVASLSSPTVSNPPAVPTRSPPLEGATPAADGAPQGRRQVPSGSESNFVDGMLSPQRLETVSSFQKVESPHEDDLPDERPQQSDERSQQNDTAIPVGTSTTVAQGSAGTASQVWTSAGRTEASVPAVQRNLSNRSDVIIVQKELRDLGYYSGNINGIWGNTSRIALRDYKLMNGLPDDDRWDEQTNNLLSSNQGTAASGTFIGDWSLDANLCPRDRDLPAPLAINSRGAQTALGKCDFRSVKREEPGRWVVRAVCWVEGNSWDASITLKLAGMKLSWSSERGTTVYLRCPKS